MNIGQCIGLIVDLYNGVFIQAVDLAVGPLPYHFASFDRKLAVTFGDRNHLGKACHLENLVDCRRCVDDLELRKLLPEPQNNTESSTGYVFKVFGIKCHRRCLAILQFFQELLFHRGCIAGINPAIKL